MKAVDQKYSYDELEGFEPVAAEKRQYNAPVLTIREGLLTLNKPAAEIVCQKKYIRFSYNKDRKLILAAGTDEWDIACIEVTRNKEKVGFSCRKLSQYVEKECRYDSFITMIKIPGKPAKSKPNALIFDLAAFSTCKIPKKKK